MEPKCWERLLASVTEAINACAKLATCFKCLLEHETIEARKEQLEIRFDALEHMIQNLLALDKEIAVNLQIPPYMIRKQINEQASASDIDSEELN